VTQRICIVVPVLNGARWLDQALTSVFAQSGPFTIRCHVQDGGSSDGTLELLRSWSTRIESGAWPAMSAGVSLTYSTGPDRGMYDAINRGAETIGIQDDDVMTWLNADDGLMPGAVACISQVLARCPDVHWIGGRTALADETGCVTHLYPARTFERSNLRAGLHDGRRLPFVMQEGTFWRGWVWRRAGGLDGKLRLAGDFDLWRRYAEYFDYHVADTLFAFHRRRSGQLSENMDAYYREVDAVVDAEARDAAWEKREAQIRSRQPVPAGPAVLFHGEWTVRDRHEPVPHEFVGTNWRALFGFDDWEGPYPDFQIQHPVRWAQWPVAHFEYRTNSKVRGTLSIRVRNVVTAQHVTVASRDTAFFETDLASDDLRQPQWLRIPVELQAGTTTFELRTRQPAEGGNRKNLGLLVERVVVEPLEALDAFPQRQPIEMRLKSLRED
jgi:hypothetical protein